MRDHMHRILTEKGLSDLLTDEIAKRAVRHAKQLVELDKAQKDIEELLEKSHWDLLLEVADQAVDFARKK